jgi:hypothetical protein
MERRYHPGIFLFVKFKHLQCLPLKKNSYKLTVVMINKRYMSVQEKFIATTHRIQNGAHIAWPNKLTADGPAYQAIQ